MAVHPLVLQYWSHRLWSLSSLLPPKKWILFIFGGIIPIVRHVIVLPLCFTDSDFIKSRITQGNNNLHFITVLGIVLTHLTRLRHICVSASVQLVAYSAPRHYSSQCWLFINWTLGNKLQWHFNQNTKLVIHENASENIVCEMAATLSRGRWGDIRMRSH